MTRTAGQTLPIEREMMGHYEVVYSPDDGGYYASMWWDKTIDSPIFDTESKANRWARKHGGTVGHYSRSLGSMAER